MTDGDGLDEEVSSLNPIQLSNYIVPEYTVLAYLISLRPPDTTRIKNLNTYGWLLTKSAGQLTTSFREMALETFS